MNEQQKYSVIKKLVETNGNKHRAALTLGCTVRHINRMIQGYKKEGKTFFVHGNRGRKPAHALEEDKKQTIIDLYRTKYYDANITHYAELLKKHENIEVSPSCIRNILLDEYILSPRARKATKKKLAAQLKEQKKTAKTKKEINKIDNAIIDIEDAHPRRPRCAYVGEMLQMDASEHLWFGEKKESLTHCCR